MKLKTQNYKQTIEMQSITDILIYCKYFYSQSTIRTIFKLRLYDGQLFSKFLID